MQFKVYGLSMYKSLALTELHTFHVDIVHNYLKFKKRSGINILPKQICPHPGY